MTLQASTAHTTRVLQVIRIRVTSREPTLEILCPVKAGRQRGRPFQVTVKIEARFFAPGDLCLTSDSFDISLTDLFGSLDMKVSLTMIRPYQHDGIGAVVSVWCFASHCAHPVFDELLLDQEADNMRNVNLAFAETFVAEIGGTSSHPPTRERVLGLELPNCNAEG